MEVFLIAIIVVLFVFVLTLSHQVKDKRHQREIYSLQEEAKNLKQEMEAMKTKNEQQEKKLKGKMKYRRLLMMIFFAALSQWLIGLTGAVAFERVVSAMIGGAFATLLEG